MKTCAFAVVVLLAVAGCAAPAARAAPGWNRVVLVELFTSQGCSSCPAADALVRELPTLGLARDRVVPLTFHVDYWDGLGWKDPFASSEFTERQSRYGHSPRLRSPDGDGRPPGLYTPQMVVNGGVHFSGARRSLALAQIERAAAATAPLALTADARINGDTARVTVTATPGAGFAAGDDWRVRGALAIKSARTAVPSGENAGERLEEAAIVRVLSDGVALPRNRAPVVVELRKPHELAWRDVELAIFVQSETTLEIAGAVAPGLPGLSGR